MATSIRIISAFVRPGRSAQTRVAGPPFGFWHGPTRWGLKYRTSRSRIIGLVATAALAIAVLPSAVLAHEGQGGSVGAAVVAIVDSGINPYHVEFRDDSPRAQQHPSTYLPGFPADAEALHLTLDAASYEEAVNADCEVWGGVEKGKLYWFPGTRIVGGISFVSHTPSCQNGHVISSLVLDADGHGTMSASRAAASTYGACPTCLVVAVQYPMSIPIVLPTGTDQPARDAITWTADQHNWIDVQSNSWGPYLPVWDPARATGLMGANPEFVEDVEKVSATQPAFWASGNGAAFRNGAAGHPTPLLPHATPSAILVGGHDSGYVNTWPGFPPHLVSDSCDSWAARGASLDASGDRVGGGTSAATPFVAGGAAQILSEARQLLGDVTTGQDASGPEAIVAKGDPGGIRTGPLADGRLTRAEWQRVLYATATARPEAQFEDGPPCGDSSTPYNETPVRWSDVPDGYPEFLHIGYGAVDRPALALASDVLAGVAPPPDRATTDTYFTAHHTVGDVTHQVYVLP